MAFNRFNFLSGVGALFLIVLFVVAITAQTKHPGVESFEKGDFKAAASKLSEAVRSAPAKSDAAMWNYLGLTYNELGKAKEAAKAFQTAVRLEPASSAYNANAAYAYSLTRQPKKARAHANEAYRLDPASSLALYLLASFDYQDSRFDRAEERARRAVEINPKLAVAYRLLAEVHMANLGERLRVGTGQKSFQDYLDLAINELENGIGNSTDGASIRMLNEILEPIKAFRLASPGAYEITPDQSNTPRANVTNYQIKSKPFAPYTDRARAAGTQGSVRLKVILGKDGKVGPILIIRALPNGLTESAVSAARGIQFDPKIVDGKPVSVIVTLEYGFNIY